MSVRPDWKPEFEIKVVIPAKLLVAGQHEIQMPGGSWQLVTKIQQLEPGRLFLDIECVDDRGSDEKFTGFSRVAPDELVIARPRSKPNLVEDPAR